MTKKYKFLIVASTFYPKITEGLLNGAVTELKRLKFNYDVFRVNGSLEIPVQIAILLKKKNTMQLLQWAVLLKVRQIIMSLLQMLLQIHCFQYLLKIEFQFQILFLHVQALSKQLSDLQKNSIEQKKQF